MKEYGSNGVTEYESSGVTEEDADTFKKIGTAEGLRREKHKRFTRLATLFSVIVIPVKTGIQLRFFLTLDSRAYFAVAKPLGCEG